MLSVQEAAQQLRSEKKLVDNRRRALTWGDHARCRALFQEISWRLNQKFKNISIYLNMIKS